MRRAVAPVIALAAMLGAFVAAPSPAAAHASLERSSPSDGELLDASPERIVLWFTEPPDLSLTTIGVVSASGAPVDTGAPMVGPTDLAAAVTLEGPLADGVYTVAWRTVSRTDGHVTASALTFGVGVQPESLSRGPAPAEETPPPSALSVAGRSALYVGLVVLLGGAVGGLVAFGATRAAWPAVLIGAWALAGAGVVSITLAERASVGVPLGTLLASGTGGAFIRLGLAVAGLGLAVLAASLRTSRATLAVLAAGVGVAMLVRAEGGHADGPLEILIQWLHLGGVGVWIGGLVWLVLALRRELEPAAIRRFSNLAAGGLALVALTGVLRSANELGGLTWWLDPFRTGYSTTLTLKLLAVVPLVALGAANRFRNVPRVERLGRRPLARVVSGEIALGIAVFGLTGVMTGLPPTAPAGSEPPRRERLVVSGADFATTTRVRLELAPGAIGPNRFAAEVTDYDTGDPVEARQVSLAFDLAGRPEVASSLGLDRADDGSWRARGTNLSVHGIWDVTALVETAGGAVEVPLVVTPRPPGQDVRVSRAPGQPDLYTIRTADGIELQAYVDPGAPGRTNQVHVTAFDGSGGELPLRSAELRMAPPDGEATAPEPIRLGPGHFVANVELSAGRWTFAVTAETRDGQTLVASFDQEIGA